METLTLEQIIRQNVDLPPYPSARGWYPVLHTQCDHGKKGKRAGFKFEGDVVAFHCFNCPLNAVYNPAENESMPPNMVKALDDFGIPEEEWQQVLFANLERRDKDGSIKSQKTKKVESIEPMEIPVPPLFYKLKDAASDDTMAIAARMYLEEIRGVDPDKYPYMLSYETDDPRFKKWFGRIIIPIYKKDKLIFYVGRDMTGKAVKKYESPAYSRDKILYGFDQLFSNTTSPLYVVEGLFDAFAIDGVAIIGNEFSEAKIKWLNKSPRQKVYVPDRYGSGKGAAEQALEAGWHISTPEIGQCKDLDEAVKRYGKLYVYKTLADNTSIGIQADTQLNLFCMK